LGKMGEQGMNRFFRSKIVLGFAVALGMSVLAADAQATHNVSSGFDAAATITGVVRYRNFQNSGPSGAAEIQVGTGLNTSVTPPTVTNSTPGHLTWAAGNTTIKITYDGTNLTTEVGSAPVTVQKNMGALSPLNYLQITINKTQMIPSISLNNLDLDGHSLGNRQIGAGSSGTSHWNVTGINLQNGFTLTGTLVLSSPLTVFNPGDSNFAQIAVGWVPPSDIEAPVVSNVDVTPKPVILNGDATVTANVDDSTTGSSTIASAEYSLNGGPWTLMNASASNSPFDAVSEDVEATFTATEVGTHEVCVRGTDAANNTSSGDDCQEFLVTYDFEGFFSPVENSPVLNIVKAGQSVPVKWRLTDANGAPIGYSSSFVNLYSYQINCVGLAREGTDEVEEYAGSSGLQYIGDGYWQFNWKTPKTYADSCRAMYVQFNSGGESPAALFQFKR
jgi:hypothetical protein